MHVYMNHDMKYIVHSSNKCDVDYDTDTASGVVLLNAHYSFSPFVFLHFLCICLSHIAVQLRVT